MDDIYKDLKNLVEKTHTAIVLEKNKKISIDQGAYVSNEDTEPKILITKSDGSYLYLTTDLATVLNRINNENRGDIIVQYSKIKPIKASKKYYVNSTDEYPILFVIAALTNGRSVFKGIGDLANKESNRIVEMQKILKQIEKKIKVDSSIIRHLTVKYKKLDVKFRIFKQFKRKSERSSRMFRWSSFDSSRCRIRKN